MLAPSHAAGWTVHAQTWRRGEKFCQLRPPAPERQSRRVMNESRPLFLAGQWRRTDTSVAVANPATGEPFASVCTLSRAGVAQAVGDAHAAFGAWRPLPAGPRGAFLRKIADQLEQRTNEIARTVTLENGKPLAQSVGEVAMSIDHLRWFAEEARRAYGRIVPHQTDGKRHLVVKTP